MTLKEIAELCGVSTTTVSNILNGKPKVSEATRQRVLEVVRDNDYQPNYFARGMRKKPTKTIGIITEDLKEFSATPIVETIMEVCEEQGYHTLLINLRLYDKWQDTWYQDREKICSVVTPALHQLQTIKVDGILYVAGHCRTLDFFPEDFPIPVLVVYAMSENARYTSVIIDDENGSYNVTKYLLSMGHRRIGVIAGRNDNYHTSKRLIGYQRALWEAGIDFDERIVRYGTWERASGYEAMEALCGQDITGVFCMNDSMAAGAYDYLWEHGYKVGEDYSMAGYDNQILSAYLRPLLTTNDIRLGELGRTAATLFLEELASGRDRQKPGQTVLIESKMVIRDSVRRLTESKKE